MIRLGPLATANSSGVCLGLPMHHSSTRSALSEKKLEYTAEGRAWEEVT